VLGSHLSESDWQLVQAILEHQELLLQQHEQQEQQQSMAAAARQQHQDAASRDAAAAAASSDDDGADNASCGVEAVEFVVRECDGISQVCMVTASMQDDGDGHGDAGKHAGAAPAPLSSVDGGRDWGWPLSLSTWDESALHG
jgi:GAF domain-containing protein